MADVKQPSSDSGGDTPRSMPSPLSSILPACMVVTGAERTAGLRRSRHTLTVSIVLSICALAVCIVIDIMKCYQPIFPALPMMGVATLAMLIAPLLVHLAGTWQYPQTYHLWQPFRGSAKFVLMQSFGWTMYTLSSMMAIVVTNGIRNVTVDGLITLIGALSFAGEVLLVVSISEFHDHNEREFLRQLSSPQTPSPFTFSSTNTRSQASSQTSRLLISSLLQSPLIGVPVGRNQTNGQKEYLFGCQMHANTVVSLFLSIGFTVLLLAIDLLRFNPQFSIQPVMSFAIAALIFAAVLTHVYEGPKRHKHYRIWQPFFGGSLFVLMQSIGWTLFAVTLSLVLVGLKEYDSLVSLPIHGLITSVGCLGLIAQIFLLASLDHFDHTNGTVATSNINTAIPAPIAASNNQTLPSSVPIISDVYDSHTPLPPIGVLPFVKDGTYPWTGEALVSIIFALGGLCLFIIVDAVKSYYHRTFLSSLLASIANIDERPPYNPPAGPLPTLYISVLASILLLIASPVAHMSGFKVHAGYQFYQPFSGGFNYILCQALGWTMYSINAMLTLIYLGNGGEWFGVTLFGVFLFTADLLILYSIPAFTVDSPPTTTVVSPPSTSPASGVMVDTEKDKPTVRFAISDQKRDSKVCYDLSGESLVAFFLALFAFLLYVVVDLMRARSRAYGYLDTDPVAAATTAATATTSVDENTFLSKFPAHHIMGFSTVGYILAAPSVLYAGTRKYPDAYRFWQPFEGGSVFVRLQAFGWTIFAVGLLVQIILVVNPLRTIHTDGALTAVGAAGFIAHILLLVSLQYFDENNQNRKRRTSDRSDRSESTTATTPRAVSSSAVVVTATIENKADTDRAPTISSVMSPTDKFVPTSPLADSLAADLKQLKQLLDSATRSKVRTVLQSAITELQSEIKSAETLHAASSPFVRNLPMGEIAVSIFLSVSSFALWIMLDLLRRLPSEFSSSLNALAFFINLSSFLSPPFVHIVIGRKMYKTYKIWQPFAGGRGYVVLQGFGWGLVSISTFILAPMCMMFGVERIEVDGVLFFVGSVSFVGQILLVLSLKFFDASDSGSNNGNGGNHNNNGSNNVDENGENDEEEDFPWYDIDQLDDRSPPIRREGLVSLFMVISALCGLFCVEILLDRIGHFQTLPILLCATAAIISALPITYYFASKRKQNDGYTFWQPFEGGPRFVAMQAAGWSLYALTLLSAFVCIHWVVERINPMGWLLTSTGLTGLIAHIIIVSSLQYFEPTNRPPVTAQTVVSAAVPTKSLKRRPTFTVPSFKQVRNFIATLYTHSTVENWRALLSDARMLCAVSLLYTIHLVIYGALTAIVLAVRSTGAFVFYSYLTVHAFVGGYVQIALDVGNVASVIYLLVAHNENGQHTGTAIWMLCGGLYCLTYYSNSHWKGGRRWHALCEWSGLWREFTRYFSFELIGLGELKPNTPYLFGFHPHGIYPYTIVWGTLSDEWRARYPGVLVDGLGASILVAVPFLRDVGLWLGGRDVTRHAITHALSNKRAVCLVPGGQAEMREARSSDKNVTLVTRHQGFVRIAIQNGAQLVPTYSFGEHRLFDNVYLPRVQNWFLHTVGFGYPHFPYGRAYLPIPRRTKIGLVVGHPIDCSAIQSANPAQSDVDRIHAQYFATVKQLFETYKARFGMEHSTLIIKEEHSHSHGHSHSVPASLSVMPLQRKRSLSKKGQNSGEANSSPTNNTLTNGDAKNKNN